MLEEELLAVWLRLTSVIDNQRLAITHASEEQAPLPFNEAMVCGLLSKAQEAGAFLTASDLCRQTCILKSQMNAILRSLERKGFVSRCRSHQDRRRIELRLLPEGETLYRHSHRHSIAIVSKLTGRLGVEEARTLLVLLRRTVEIFEDQQQEV